MKTHLFKCFCAAILVLCVSCGKDESSSGSPSSPSSGMSGNQQKSRPGKLRFLDRIDPEKYPEAKGPESPVLIRWDFSKEEEYPYSYSQIMSQETDMGEGRSIKADMDAEGDLVFKSEGDKTARLVLQDMKIRMNMKGESEPMIQNMPPVVVQGVQENGTMKTGMSQQELLLAVLFPMPEKAVKPGETAEKPAAMPFNLAGSVITVTGKCRTKHTGCVTVDGDTCVRLETDIDISEFNIPPEIKGTYECCFKGRSVFYYSLKEKAFISGNLALLINMKIEADIPKMNVPDSSMKLPDKMQMSMSMDSLITLKRKKK